ncbi:FAD-dependent oxidoreductase [Stutzerimonas azotifigens]|uniref:FAD-dependent oxidoreductase n=1 Tax=Stutzerimonas azotifigens TaxID=291995 RepID=A0ABR5YWB4_9GAMM|nr:bifunctional TVP38/TMEM64 family protein/FAD-dependent oxidoreductase [Stutzerimonas azotifigens]MBA1272208.1 FAD-dependent oxidoreductase [Stutzerimonas azotifigens]
MNARKLVVIGLILAAVASFFFFDLGQYLTLESIKRLHGPLRAEVRGHPWWAGALFFLAYAGLTAFSFPGTVVLTLLGGALFGLIGGTLLVSFASTVGAAIAMLMSRFMMRDWFQKRFGRHIAGIDRGLARDGPLYLFSLRLMPVIPFVLLNPALGLTRVKFWTFWWTTWAGMLPGNAVYVAAGRELARIDSLSGILSPSMITTLVLLGVFPLLANKLLGVYKARKAYKGWRKPKRFERNLIVIGAGAGGLAAAELATSMKARVTLIERKSLGGDSLNTGSVPSKALIRSARLAHEMARGERLGLVEARGKVDFAAVMERVRAVIEAVALHDSVERYEKLGVEVIAGEARVVSPWEVEVDGRTLSARNLIIATGSRPTMPDIPGLADVEPLTSDSVWSLRQRPERLLVLGGGPVACELGQAFQRLGSQVTLVHRGDRLLACEEPEAGEVIAQTLRAEGMDVRLGHVPQRFEVRDGERRMVCQAPHGSELSLPFDEVLVAVGRSANLEGFGLEQLRLEPGEDGTLEVNEYLATRMPNIYAIGDVAGPYRFTHMAARQARYAVFNGLFGMFWRLKMSYRVTPRATFTSPQVARVGLCEHEAREQDVEFEVTRFDLAELDRAIADEAPDGFVKVLTVPGKDRILGVTVVGEHASETITEFVMAMKHKIGLKKLLETVHIYPTFAEANHSLATVWKRDHAPQRLLRWAERINRRRVSEPPA